MKINNIQNTAVNEPSDKSQNTVSNDRTSEKEASQFNKDTGSVFAGDLNLGNDIENKKKKAQSMAMELMTNVFEQDKKTDDEIQSRNNNIQALYDENQETQDKINDMERERSIVKEGYGITDESQEEHDLNLLRKERDSLTDPFIIITDEEKAELEQIHTNGFTPYQKEMLTMDSAVQELRDRIDENKKQIFEDSAAIKEIHINRLKTHDMVDAKKQGDEIIAAANKEIMGDIIEQGKEAIDEKTEENEELKEKYEEAKEKLDEYLDKEKDDDHEEMYELSREYTEIQKEKETSTLPDTKKSINQIINELNLTIEDIKGVVVDTDA